MSTTYEARAGRGSASPEDAAAETPDPCYRFGDVLVSVRCSSPVLRAEVERAWGGCRGSSEPDWSLSVLDAGDRPDLDAQIVAGRLVHQSFLYPEVPFRAFELPGGIGFAVLEDQRAVLDFERRSGVACATESASGQRTRSVVNTLLVPMLNELLAREGQFLMHCAALERSGRGVVIAGASGDGKTTAALALMARGYRLLSDDTIVLDGRRSPPAVRGVAREVRVCPPTLALIPRLAPLAGRALDEGKVPILVEELQGAAATAPIVPDLVLFPTGELESGEELRPIAGADALATLVPHGMFVAGTYGWDRRISALIDLVSHARSYLVRRHLPVDRLADLVDRLHGGPAPAGAVGDIPEDR